MIDGRGRHSWTDTHCHVQDSYLTDPDGDKAVLSRALAAGVERLICVGTDEVSSRQAVELAGAPRADGEAARVWATVGLHPHEAASGLASVQRLLEQIAKDGAQQKLVVAVGECGLDYFYEHSPRDAQRRAFAEQIALANRFALALVVHSRDAWDDTVEILSQEGVPVRTVIHCFTGGPAEAQRMLELGTYLSFSGIVTFKNADEVRNAARLCPGDRILVETDSPFLAPVPHRGRPNEPAFVTDVGAAVASLRGVDEGEFARQTSANATKVFALTP